MTRTALGTLAALLLTCATASAQASRFGLTFSQGGTPTVFTPDVAYDNVHSRYLTVHGRGFIEGVLSGEGGNIISTFFINSSHFAVPAGYAQTARVAFSPDVNGGAGGYLVTWHESIGNFAQVRGRLVSADGVPIGGDIVISLEAVSVQTSSNWLMGAAVAYSPANQEFLVAWMGSFNTTNDIRCNRVSAAGVVLQAAVTPVTTASPDWERDPAVAYNPDSNEFFIVYAGWHNALNYAYVAGQRVQPGSGLLIGPPVEYDQIGGNSATYIPAVTYNQRLKQYLAVWYHAAGSLKAFYGIRVNADGSPATGLIAESSYYVAYDALDVKYNPVSGDHLLVTHSNTYEDAAVSIRADGTPYDNGFLVTATTGTPGQNGNFNPRLAATDKGPRWLTVTASGFQFLGSQFVVSSASPPAPVSRPMLSIDTPVGGAVQGAFMFSGWAADLASLAGPGADVVHVYAWPVAGGNPTFIGVAPVGWNRPDVAGVYGGQFGASGYGLTVSGLPGGTYQLAGYMHSTVTNSFAVAKSVPITVSDPRMVVDSPSVPWSTQASNARGGFNISGWSVDLGAPAGSGVNTLHVWAWPWGGGPPIFCGVASYPFPRPDVAQFFGNNNFYGSGFVLTVNLPPGSYQLGVFSQSAVTGTFNNVQWVFVNVQ